MPSEHTEAAPRFAADVMLGALAQYLLLTGFDCTYHHDIDDSDLFEHARHQNRILLTRDTGLTEEFGEAVQSCLLRSKHVEDQFITLVDRFDLEITDDKLFTRCTVCNLNLKSVSPDAVEDLVPPQTFQWLDQFFQCPGCKKVYWKGTHYQAVRNRLERWEVLEKKNT